MAEHDPSSPGKFSVVTRTVEARDSSRDRVFPIEIWSPKNAPGPLPLIVYSHPSGASRRSATFLTTHLASHGYRVAALDHSETIAPELARRENESDEQRTKRVDGWIANRVPDIRFLIDTMESDCAGIVGHSFGGWTALAATGADRRIGATVALTPAGGSNPRPGILAVQLDLNWDRDVPTLYIAAENDASVPMSSVRELYERAHGTKEIFVLKRADHLHFLDNIAELHERVRTMPMTGDFAAIQRDMLPMSELCSEEEAHRVVRGLTLAHFDRYLRC